MQKNSKIILVIDVGNPDCDGKLFDRDFLSNISHTLLPIYELVKMCDSLGIKCVTPDVVLSKEITQGDQELLLISHLVNNRTTNLISRGAKPFLLLCQESPMIATRFYTNFRNLSKPFAYTLAFSGMKKRAHVKTNFIPLHFPVYFDTRATPTIPFSEKKLIALIAGNKSAPAWKAVLMKLFFGTKVKLIYPVRKKFVTGLASKKVIDLYGKGWDTDSNESVRAVYKGLVPADGKLETLSKYKFTLCFENAIFPGYVTEKLFDALLAGSVPVYLGDPDIFESIPKNIFVDAREFTDVDSLHRYLSNMSKDIYEQYRKAGEEFLTSSAFDKFSYETFIEKVINLIKSYEFN